jgi:hypothetical protein
VLRATSTHSAFFRASDLFLFAPALRPESKTGFGPCAYGAIVRCWRLPRVRRKILDKLEAELIAIRVSHVEKALCQAGRASRFYLALNGHQHPERVNAEGGLRFLELARTRQQPFRKIDIG